MLRIDPAWSRRPACLPEELIEAGLTREAPRGTGPATLQVPQNTRPCQGADLLETHACPEAMAQAWLGLPACHRSIAKDHRDVGRSDSPGMSG
jgi:hypothetical protein